VEGAKPTPSELAFEENNQVKALNTAHTHTARTDEPDMGSTMGLHGCRKTKPISDLEPGRRIELLTYALRVRCSTD
jgi:hypothetical protein